MLQSISPALNVGTCRTVLLGAGQMLWLLHYIVWQVFKIACALQTTTGGPPTTTTTVSCQASSLHGHVFPLHAWQLGACQR